MAGKRHSKILGISVGERSMLIADVAAAGEKPDVRKLAEFVFPEGVSLADGDKLGSALAAFLKSEALGTRTAVIGLPARWLVMKHKEVPPADPQTLADMLRLQAETEFSTELKDLVYDYAGTGPVLLVATPKRHIEGALAACDKAGLHVVGVTSTAMALGEASGADMVLAVNAAGAELTAAHGSSVRHLRAPVSERAFAGELRRAVSTIPANGGGRELLLWDALGLDATALAGELGFPVKSGALAALGVTSPARADVKYAPAVAVALAAMNDRPLPLDFLHSKLAPVKRRTVPRWAWIAVAAVIALVAAGVLAFRDLAHQEAEVVALQAKVKATEDTVKSAEQFVSRVTFASGWHQSDPRYVACLRSITQRMPDDNQTFATKLSIREATRTVQGKTIRTGDLAGELFGKTSDQQLVTTVIDSLKADPDFVEVTWGEMRISTRSREVSFSIKFVYRSPAAKPAAK